MAATDTLSPLRSLMASHSPPLDALMIPSEDYHQSEYVSSRDKRRQFVSGFTGSAGLALVTMHEARLWTDGRYFLQATQQLSDQWQLMRMGEDAAVESWIADNLPEKAVVGVDTWCVSIDTAHRWEHAFGSKQQKLVHTSKNLVDEIWTERPPAEVNPVIIQPVEFSGRPVGEKLNDLRGKLIKEKSGALIVTALDEVAWLFNIRGTDVSYCPLVHAFAVVTSGDAFFYVDKRKVSPEVQAYMMRNRIEVRDYDRVGTDVTLLGSNGLTSSFESPQRSESSSYGNGSDSTGTGNSTEGKECNLIWADPGSCCYALYSKLNPSQLLLQQSPLALAKALKNSRKLDIEPRRCHILSHAVLIISLLRGLLCNGNPVEMDGLKKCHIRDGAAVVQFLVWLDKQMQELYGASGYFSEAKTKEKERPSESNKLTEVSVSDKLESFRASKEHFRGLSFPTISSVGPNAAIIHYGPDPKTCSELGPDSIYLFDSGAQYADGTTDITRTVHFGCPSSHEKESYTAVLKGHIALGNARFPNGTNGHALDIIARVPLWKHGLDYRHGTGHGIGSYLNVHEGPHLISFRPQARNVPLQASMTVTDEPGYYEDGNFGIRLENVLVIKEAKTPYNFGEKGYLEFEHITWAPYQRKLMDLSLLSPEEVTWVNSYHSKCREVLAPYLNDTEMAWLTKATEPISA